MPTKRTRKVHQRRAEVSKVALYYASDGLWGERPTGVDLDEFLYGYPGCSADQCRMVWLAVRDELLPSWVKEYPGTRPSWWYLFDPECPRMSDEEIERHGWTGWFFAKDLPDLRRRLGGVGDPIFEHLNYVPHFDCAVPDHFVSAEDVRFYRSEGEKFRGKPIDPRNPPKYESEASYLKRHRLLATVERQRLRKKDFEPEIITTEETGSEPNDE